MSSYWAARLIPPLLLALLVQNLYSRRFQSPSDRSAAAALPPVRHLHPPSDRSRHLLINNPLLKGPESFTRSPTGAIYTGTSDGTLYELLPASNGTHVLWSSHYLGNFGRVTGIKSIKIHEDKKLGAFLETLLLCDIARGLMEVELLRPIPAHHQQLQSAVLVKSEVLLSQVDQKDFKICNAIAFTHNPHGNIQVVITDSSELPLSMLGADIFAVRGSGRIILFQYSAYKQALKLSPNISSSSFAKTLIDKLRFPNGLYLLPQQQPQDPPTINLLVAETLGRSLLHIKFDSQDGSLVYYKAVWSGRFHADNIKGLRPQKPVGWEALGRESYFGELDNYPEDLVLIGIPHSSSVWHETYLFNSKRVKRFISGWVPLPVRITLGNPMLIGRSVLGLFNVKTMSFEAIYESGEMESLALTSEALLIDSDRRNGGTILIGSFGNSTSLRMANVRQLQTKTKDL